MKCFILSFVLVCASAGLAMSQVDAYNDLYFGIRVSVDGAEVCSTNIYYSLRDQYATPSPQNINNANWTAIVATNGWSMTLTISAADPGETGSVIGRFVMVSASAAVRVKCYASLHQLISCAQDDYAIAIDGREAAVGSAAVGADYTMNALPTLQDLWSNLDNPNKNNFGGLIRVEIWTLSHLPLYNPAGGQLMRGATHILRDD